MNGTHRDMPLPEQKRSDPILCEPIAIVGMDCIFPGAPNLAAFWRNAVRGANCLTPIPLSRWRQLEIHDLLPVPGGFIDESIEFDPLPFGIMPAEVEEGDPEQFLVLSVIERALRDLKNSSGRHGIQVLSPERTELVIGRGSFIGNGAEHLYLRMDLIEQITELLAPIFPGASNGVREEIRKRLVAALPPVTPEVVACAMPSLVAGRAANRLNVMGRNYTVDAACASSLVALDNVVRSLRERRCDLGIAAGVHICQKPGFWLAFQTIGAMSRSGVCRPFADDADGLLMGEGIGVVVLKRLADALQDGDRIYAAIRAVGVASDGRGTAVMTPRVEGQILALRRAYEEAGIDPQRVTLVEGHGTATVVGDSAEIDTLHAILGRDGPSVALGSVKSMIGHAMPAAGMAGLIKTALAVYHRLLPPTLNVERVNPKLAGSRFCVNTSVRPWVPLPETPRTAGVNAFGFGGINAHVILEEVADQGAWESLTPQSSELFLASAESPAQLLDRLRLWSQRSTTLRDEDLGDICFTEMERVSDAHPVRVAIVAKSIADLREKLERAPARIVAEKDRWWQDPSGIYYGSSRKGGNLAFLFPGIGFPGLAGGYAARLAELYLHFPEIRKNLDVLDGLTEDETPGPPLSYQLFPPPLLDREALAEIDRQLAWSERSPTGMSMANMASWDLLQSFGLQPDAVAGFSLGELSALFASGVINRERFYSDTYRQLRNAMKESSQSSEKVEALWAIVATSAEQAEAIMHHIPGDLSVTMDVAPSQIFIGGDKAAVRAALQKFQDAGIWGQALPVFPLLRPFLTVHTEMAVPFEAQMRAIVETIRLSPGKCPVYSGTTATPYPESVEAIREMILASITQRVRFRDTFARLYADGVRIFVQMGAGGKMLSTVENTLAGLDYVALSTDVPHRGGLEQVHHLLGRLATLGVPFQLSALYRYRRCRPVALEKATVSASPGARKLFLAPPRLRLSAEASEWMRAQCVIPQSQVATDIAPGFSPAGAALKGGATSHRDGKSIAEQSLALMGRFLDVQRSWEATENELLRQFLETQAKATALFSSAQTPQVASSAETASAKPTPLRRDRPFVGEIQRLVPGLELESRLVLDLSQHFFLSHHAFLNIPDGLKPVEERLPTLPLTFELEILSEVAEALVPGLRVIACHDLEAKRWICFESKSTLEVTIRARRVDNNEVEAELYTEGNNAPEFRGRATLSVDLPPPPPPLEQVYDRNCPHTAAEFYGKGPFFHGPMFHLIRSFRAMSDRDVGAELIAGDPGEYLAAGREASLVFEPVLLDALQQIGGYRAWLDGWYTMPVGLKRISLYGPTPAPGSPIRASLQYRRLDGRRNESDYEAYDATGQLWMRVESLQGWRVLTPKTLMEANHRPREGYLARPWPVDQPEITCYRVISDHLGDIKPEWMARLYLRADEWAVYKQRPALNWLLGRIAAKDAVRDWLRQHKGILLHPLEVEIANQADGAPRLLIPGMPSLAISIAHIDDEAIAIVCQAPGVGVDLAAVKERGRDFFAFAFRDDELSSLPQSSREAWIHRGWCAKEAAVKAFRLGFAALPQFRIIAVQEKTGAVEMGYKPRGIKITAATWIDQNRAIAVVVSPS
jgi:acyl transferase domain-containing protein/phosphopantetheinyl transferase (holo-ACP synthase)